MNTTIKRVAPDVVEVTIGMKRYHVLSDDAPFLYVKRLGKSVATEKETSQVFHLYHQFRRKEEFGEG